MNIFISALLLNMINTDKAHKSLHFLKTNNHKQERLNLMISLFSLWQFARKYHGKASDIEKEDNKRKYSLKKFIVYFSLDILY